MKLLTFSYFYPPYVGGVENIACEGVKALANRGHEIVVLTSSFHEPRASAENSKGKISIVEEPLLHPHLSEDTPFDEMFARIDKLLDKENFDGVHSHLLTYPWIKKRSEWLLENLQNRGIPVVDQTHGGSYERNFALCLQLMGYVENMISDSYSVKSRLENLCEEFNNANGSNHQLPEIEVLYPAIASQKIFQPDNTCRQAVRKELEVKDDEFLVFFPSRFFDIDGSLSVAKKPLVALQVFGLLHKFGTKNIRFMAILPPGFSSKENESEARRTIRDLIYSLNIEEKVIFLNKRVLHQDMASYFNAADATVVPSFEGFGLVYLESILCGTPVVAINAGASKEIIDEETGILVNAEPDPSENLAHALVKIQNALQRGKYISKSKLDSVFEKFNFESWGKELENILSRSFNKNGL